MRKRYEIQACDLEETKSKSRVVWHCITTAWSFNGALGKFKSVNKYCESYPVVVRVVDRKTGKAIH